VREFFGFLIFLFRCFSLRFLLSLPTFIYLMVISFLNFDSADTLYLCYCIDKEAGERRREEVFIAVRFSLYTWILKVSYIYAIFYSSSMMEAIPHFQPTLLLQLQRPLLNNSKAQRDMHRDTLNISYPVHRSSLTKHLYHNKDREQFHCHLHI